MVSKGINKSRRKSDRHRMAAGDDLIRAEKLDAIARASEIASHKVNNFLTIVLNYVFILKNSAADEKSLSLLKKIENGVNKAKDVVQEIADPARPAIVAMEKRELSHDLDRIINEFLSSSGASGVEITRRLCGSSSIMASKKGLNILISNLLTNAVEANAKQIRVSCRHGGQDLVIAISDTGQGMGKEALRLAFEPFFTSKPGHKGLGLYVCHHIVRHFGGFISFGSREGKGSRFTIYLPMAKTP